MTPAIRKGKDGEVTLDTIFRALGHSTRRHVLTTIFEHNPRAELESTDFVETMEEQERRHLELFHQHLPALDDAGFIEWDRQTDSIRRGPRYGDIRPLVRLMIEHEDELPDGWP